MTSSRTTSIQSGGRFTPRPRCCARPRRSRKKWGWPSEPRREKGGWRRYCTRRGSRVCVGRRRRRSTSCSKPGHSELARLALLSTVTPRECLAQNPVGGGVEFGLEFPGGAPGLLHQRWIEQHRDAIHERSGRWDPGCARPGAAGFARRKLFVELEVAPEFLRVPIRPIERPPERDKELFAKQIEKRNRELHRRASRRLRRSEEHT